MVVVATESASTSMHFTTVPFKKLLTGLTVTLDIRDRIFGPESLEKVIVEVLTVRTGGMPLSPIDETGLVVWVTFSGKTVNSQLWSSELPDVVLHVSSS